MLKQLNACVILCAVAGSAAAQSYTVERGLHASIIQISVLEARS